jgi:hypothetical protein
MKSFLLRVEFPVDGSRTWNVCLIHSVPADVGDVISSAICEEGVNVTRWPLKNLRDFPAIFEDWIISQFLESLG